MPGMEFIFKNVSILEDFQRVVPALLNIPTGVITGGQIRAARWPFLMKLKPYSVTAK
jgi:hypothetical protein